MMEKGFKFIDLFCGIGGFHQAMTQLGGECVFASDIDTECQKTYFENYGIKPVGDITKVDAKDIPAFNVLCAGFPCQAFSKGGKQLGFNDPTRGTLFFDIIRIAKFHKPEYMLLENVQNLISHDNGRTWEVIYNSIRSAGYNVLKEPVVFSPHFIGIPQNRKRVFIMCIREDLGTIPQFYFDSSKKNLPQCSIMSVLQSDDEITNIEKYQINKDLEDLLSHWDDFVHGVDYDLPGHAIYAEFLKEDLKEEEYSMFLEYKAKPISIHPDYYCRHKEFLSKWLERGKSIKMFKNSRMHMEWQTHRDVGQSIWQNLIQLRQTGVRVKKPDFFPTLVAIVQSPIIGCRKRYITPRECARIQSFPETFKIHPTDAVAYKQFGNSVNVEVVKLFAKFLFGDEEIRAKYSSLIESPTTQELLFEDDE